MMIELPKTDLEVIFLISRWVGSVFKETIRYALNQGILTAIRYLYSLLLIKIC